MNLRDTMNLREKQDLEYEEALMNDIINDLKKKEEEIIENSYRDYIDLIRKNELMEPTNYKDNHVICTIRFFLPDSNKITRRFNIFTTTIGDLYNFIIVYFYDHYKIKNPEITICTYQHVELVQPSATLESLMFSSRETLYIKINS
jgi:hypothetical protein